MLQIGSIAWFNARVTWSPGHLRRSVSRSRRVRPTATPAICPAWSQSAGFRRWYQRPRCRRRSPTWGPYSSSRVTRWTANSCSWTKGIYFSHRRNLDDRALLKSRRSDVCTNTIILWKNDLSRRSELLQYWAFYLRSCWALVCTSTITTTTFLI